MADTSKTITICSPGTSLPLYRNSHATAVACFVDLWDLRKPGESDQVLTASAAVFLEFCECNKPGKPTAWHIGDGLQELLDLRGRMAAISERARYSTQAGEQATFDDYAASIKDNRPVILTFCYDPDTKGSLLQAARRVSLCTSVVGIGYVEANEAMYLVCHDGLVSPSEQPIETDRVPAASIGLEGEGPWTQDGTALYEWDGEYANLVMTFVTRPAVR